MAKNEEFIRFSSDVALHIAALNPRYVKREDVPQEVIKEFAQPEAFYKESCLLEQAFVKDPSRTIKDYLNSFSGQDRREYRNPAFYAFSAWAINVK